jgi:hypothetical protein
MAATPDPENSDPVLNLAVDVWKYTQHLAQQRLYFDQHAAVRHVIPVLEPMSGGNEAWRIVLHVMVDVDQPINDDDALKAVVSSVMRELGQEEGRPDDEAKYPIVQSLGRLGISRLAVAKQIKRATPLAEAEVPPSPRGPVRRTFVQYEDVRIQVGDSGLEVRRTDGFETAAPADRGSTLALSPDAELLARLTGRTLDLYLVPAALHDLLTASPVLSVELPIEDDELCLLATTLHDDDCATVVLSSGHRSYKCVIQGAAPHVDSVKASEPVRDAVLHEGDTLSVPLSPTPLNEFWRSQFPTLTRIDSIDLARTAAGKVLAAAGVDRDGRTLMIARRLASQENLGLLDLGQVELTSAGAVVAAVRGRGDDRVPVVLAFSSTGAVAGRIPTGVVE